MCRIINYHRQPLVRFLAPDNDTYEVSWVEFNMEKPENYNWNYLDFYVCTRGEQVVMPQYRTCSVCACTESRS